MAVIPSWISVNPKDFVDAAQGGARIGAELAGQQNESNIAAGRNATALQEAQMRANAEQSAQQEAAQRAQAERQLQQWQVQQQIKGELERNQNTVAGEGQRNQNTVAAENQRALDALNENKAYHAGMLNHYDLMSKIAQQRADTADKKASGGDTTTVHADYPGSKGVPQFNSSDPGKSGIWLLRDKVPASSLTTTNASDLNAYLAQHPSATTKTNLMPGTATPSLSVPYKIPTSSLLSGKDPRALLGQPKTPPAGHIAALQANPTPKFISDFDALYGQGSASQILGNEPVVSGDPGDE